MTERVEGIAMCEYNFLVLVFSLKLLTWWREFMRWKRHVDTGWLYFTIDHKMYVRVAYMNRT
jgi:hypothetical protein